MMQLIGAELDQTIAQPFVGLTAFKHVDLHLVVLVNEGLYGRDGAIDRSRPEERRQSAEQEARDAPQWRQPRMPCLRQLLQKEVEVRLFRRAMRLRERAQTLVARYGEDALVYPDSPEFPCMIAAKLAQDSFR